jgi:hypothetical protein
LSLATARRPASLAHSFALAAVLTPALSAAPGQVWTVGASGADFTQIQPAIDAAADGDVILVKPGSYAAFAIFDTTLTVVAETPATVQVSGQVRVNGLAAGRRVVLTDLSANGTTQGALLIADNQGSVRVRGGAWVGADAAAAQGADSHAGVRVLWSADVGLCSLVVRGGKGIDFPFGFHPDDGGSAVLSIESSVALSHCQLTGGDGGTDDAGEGYSGGDGGHGLELRGGFAHATDCTFRAGDGGKGSEEDGCVPFGNSAGDGGDGGDGVHLLGGLNGYSPAHVELIAHDSAGAPGGQGGPGNCGPSGSPGFAGSAIELIGQSSQGQPPAGVRRMSADGLWRPGVPELLTFEGASGELVFLVLSPKAGFAWQPAKHGIALVGGLPALAFMGTIPAGGTLARTWTLPPLPAGWEGTTLHLQAVLVAPGSGALLTGASPTALVVPGL